MYKCLRKLTVWGWGVIDTYEKDNYGIAWSLEKCREEHLRDPEIQARN